MSTKTISYLARVAQKISREDKEKFPTAESVSDYRIAKVLDVTQQRISSYRTGRTHFDEVMAVKVARYLGLTEALVLADIWSDKAKTPEAKKAFKEAANIIKVDFKNKVKGTANALLIPIMGTVLLSTFSTESIAYDKKISPESVNNIHYTNK